MWLSSESIVHQDVNYTMLKQFGIDFAIGRGNKSEKAKSASNSSNSLLADAATEELKEQKSKEKNPGKLKSQQAQVLNLGFRQSDVFLKPFESGICIEENLTQRHRLIFNKFPARKHHVLVITKEPER